MRKNRAYAVAAALQFLLRAINPHLQLGAPVATTFRDLSIF
jgi:hypothetical protein